MAAPGLQSEAVLKLRIQLDSRSLQGTKKLLTDLTNAFKAQGTMKGMDAMAISLKNMRAELTKVKSDLKKYQDAQKQASAAEKESAARKQAQKAAYLMLAAAIAKTRAVEEANTKAVKAAALQSKIKTVQDKARVTQQNLVKAALIAILVQEKKAQDAAKAAAIVAKTRADYEKKRIEAAKFLVAMMVRQGIVETAAIKRGKQQALLDRVKEQAAGKLATVYGKLSSIMQKLTKSVSAAEQKFDALFRASYRLSMVGNTLKTFAGTIVNIGSDIMSTFGDFEYMMIRAAGTMEIWRDAGEAGNLTYTDLQDRILSLAADMRMFPAKDIAEAMYFWGSTTGQVVKTQEDLTTTTAALDTIMKAAVMTNTDYQTTIKGVYSILTQYYGGALTEAVNVTEQLFYTTQKTAAEFSDMISAFKMVGPIAAQMGVSFEEVNETIATLADLGLKGTMAGRALRQLFIQTLRPSGPAVAAMKELFAKTENVIKFAGKGFQELVFPEGEYIGITNQMNLLAEATMFATTAERQYYLAKISTANELPMLTALVAKQRRELLGLESAESKLAKSESKASIAFKKNWEGMAQSWNAVRGSVERAIESLKINIGSIMAQTLGPFMDKVENIIRSVEQFIKLHPEIVRFAAQIGAAVAAFAGAAGYLLILGGALTGVTAAVGLIIMSLKKWAAPILAASTAFGLLFAVILDNAEYIYSVLQRVIDNIKEGLGIAEDGVVNLSDAIEQILAPARLFMETIVKVVGEVLVLASNIFRLVGALNDLSRGNLIPFIVTVLSAMVSAKILLGIASMIWGVLKLASAFAVLKNGAVAAAAAQGLFNRINMGIQTMVSSLAGIALITTTILILGLVAIPEIGEAVGHVLEAFKDWGAEVDSLSASFGNLIGPRLQERLRAVASSAETFTGLILEQAHRATAFREMQVRLAEGNVDKAIAGQLKIIIAGWDEYNQALVEINSKATIGLDNYGLLVDKMLTLTGRGDIQKVVNVANTLGEVLLDNTTREELRQVWDEWGKIVFPELNYDQFEYLSSYVTDIGTISGLISERAIAAIEEAYKKTDPVDAAMYLTMALPQLDNWSISDIMAGEGDFLPEVIARAKETVIAIRAKFTESVEGALSVDTYSDTLKVAGETMVSMMFEDLFPDYSVFADKIAGYAMSGEFERAAETFLTTFVEDGRNAVTAILEDELPGASEVKSILESLMDTLPFFSDRLAALLPAEAEESGSDLGESASRAWIQGLAEGASGGFDKEEIKKALKLGRGRDMVRDIINTSSGRNMNRLMGGGLAARDMGISWLREQKPNIQGWLDRGTAKGPEEGARRLKLLQTGVRAGKDDMSKQVVTFWNNIIKANKEKAAEAKAAIRETIGAVSGWYAPGQRGAPSIPEPPKPTLPPTFMHLPLPPTIIPPAQLPTAPAVAEPVLSGMTTAAETYDYSSFLSAIYTGIIGAIEASSLSSAGKEIALSVSNGAIDAFTVWGGGRTATSLGTFASNAATAADGALKSQGAVVASKIVAGVNTGLLASSVANSMRTMVQNSVAGMISSADTAGFNVGSSWSAGFARGVSSNSKVITASFSVATEEGKGGSPPKKGPLKHIDKWGENVGAAWGEGFTKGSVDEARKMSKRIKDLRIGNDGIMNGGAEITNTHKREITVKLEVSSPDGTVNRQKQAVMRRGAMDALVVAGLEHFVTVG